MVIPMVQAHSILSLGGGIQLGMWDELRVFGTGHAQLAPSSHHQACILYRLGKQSWRWDENGNKVGLRRNSRGMCSFSGVKDGSATREEWSVDGKEKGMNRKALARPISALPKKQAPPSTAMRVAYQGEPGAYSEAAAIKAFPTCEPVPCEQFDVTFQAVEQWLVERAVLPIENSLGGSIHRNYDLLLRHRLHIVGEVQLPINHCLLALPGQRIEDLRRVLSHPQALAQCEMTLSKIGVTREAVHDTAGAAKMIAKEQLTGAGAIASRRAAEIYNLDILADGIQDDIDNVTRFLVLARDPIVPLMNQAWKTSIVFTLVEGPGVLFKALAVFAFRDINLTKIESRPQRMQPMRVPEESGLGTTRQFDYLFYIDFQASMAEERAQNALRHLQEFTPFLRVLGSYPMDTTPLS